MTRRFWRQFELFKQELEQNIFFFSVLVTAFKDTILAECADLIKDNETEKLLQMYKVPYLPNVLKEILRWTIFLTY